MATSSPNYNLTLTPEAENTKTFKTYRTELSGDGSNSNMMKIDSALTPTADPEQVPSGLSGMVSQWVSWFTNRIKAITGKTNWYDAPDITLADASTTITTLTNDKVNTSDIINDLTTGGTTVPLSAEQGKVVQQSITALGAQVGRAISSVARTSGTAHRARLIHTP